MKSEKNSGKQFMFPENKLYSQKTAILKKQSKTPSAKTVSLFEPVDQNFNQTQSKPFFAALK